MSAVVAVLLPVPLLLGARELIPALVAWSVIMAVYALLVLAFGKRAMLEAAVVVVVLAVVCGLVLNARRRINDRRTGRPEKTAILRSSGTSACA